MVSGLTNFLREARSEVSKKFDNSTRHARQAKRPVEVLREGVHRTFACFS